MEDMTLILDGTTVADGTLTGGIVEDWQAAPSEDAVDRSMPILAATPRFFALTTIAEAVTVRVARGHANYRAALAFERMHRSAIGLVGAVSFGFTEDSVAWLCSYSGTKISPIQVERTGVFTLTTYTLEFSGAPTITEDGETPPQTGMRVGAETGSVSLATAGTTNIELSATKRERYQRATMGAGAGAYTRNFVLDEDAEDGCVIDVVVSMPASLNPTVKFYTGAASGDALVTVPTDTGAATYHYLFVFNGTAGAWELWTF